MNNLFALYTIGMMNAKHWVVSEDGTEFSYKATRARLFTAQQVAARIAANPSLNAISA